MSDSTDKEELLESSGYRYHFERMMYVNKTARRAFSVEFVDDKSQQDIQELIDDLPATNDWVFQLQSAAIRPASGGDPRRGSRK